MTIAEVLGKNISKLRLEKKLTQKELSEKIGVHRNYISALERGKCNPRVKQIEKIAHVFGICSTKLFDEY